MGTILRDLEQSLRAQGLAQIYLFGSVARETQTDLSEIDLAFDVDPSANDASPRSNNRASNGNCRQCLALRLISSSGIISDRVLLVVRSET